MLKPGPQFTKFLRSSEQQKGIARKLLVRTTNIRFRGSVENVRARVEQIAINMMAGFFKETTTYLGKPTSLVSEIGGLGFRDWDALSSDWVKRKGHSNFFAYTSQSVKGKRPKLREGEIPLLRALPKVNVFDAFGIPEVVILDDKLKATQVSEKQVEVRDLSLVIHLFPKLQPKRNQPIQLLGTSSVGSAIAKVGGSLALKKLRGTPGKRGIKTRQVIGPMMSYYSKVRLPQILRERLKTTKLLGVSAPNARVIIEFNQ